MYSDIVCKTYFCWVFVCTTNGYKIIATQYIIYLVVTNNIFFRNRAITNGKSCKGNAVNFGEWDAYSDMNGLQTFPDGKWY